MKVDYLKERLVTLKNERAHFVQEYNILSKRLKELDVTMNVSHGQEAEISNMIKIMEAADETKMKAPTAETEAKQSTVTPIKTKSKAQPQHKQ